MFRVSVVLSILLIVNGALAGIWRVVMLKEVEIIFNQQ